MHRQVESELKWILDADAHRRLRARLTQHLGPGTRLEQRNRFFDGPAGELRAARSSVRLRRENQTLVFTAKRHLSDGDGHHAHLEIEYPLPMPLWSWACGAGNDLATVCPLPSEVDRDRCGAPLHCLGGFDNLRWAWHLDGEEIALDRTTLPGRVDHELEIETADPAASRRRWHDHFAAMGIEPRPQTATKLHRFLAVAPAPTADADDAPTRVPLASP